MTGWWSGLPLELKCVAVALAVFGAAWVYAWCEAAWRDR